MSGRSFLLVPILALGVGGCDFGWLGDSEAPPLPGVRESVMLFDQTASPDPALADTPIILPQALANADWPQVGGSPQHSLGHLQYTGSLQRKWSTDIGTGNSTTSRIQAAPVVKDGRIFAIDADATVSAYDLANGTRIWRRFFDLDSDRELGGGLAAADDRLFVTTAAGEVAALSAANGEEIWTVQLEAPIRAAPTVGEGRVLVLSADNQTFALDAEDGTVLWIHAGFAELSGLLGGPAPAMQDGIVAVAYSSGEVYGLNLATGLPLWLDAVQRPSRTTAISAITDIEGSPVIDPSRRVIVAGHGGEIAALDLRTGQRYWDQRLTSSETPWIAGDNVFLVTTSSEVVAIDSVSGRIRWASQLDRNTRPDDIESARIYWAGPVLANDILYVVGNHGFMVGLDPSTGEIVSESEIDLDLFLPPVVANNHLIVLDDDGILRVFN